MRTSILIPTFLDLSKTTGDTVRTVNIALQFIRAGLETTMVARKAGQMREPFSVLECKSERQGGWLLPRWVVVVLQNMSKASLVYCVDSWTGSFVALSGKLFNIKLVVEANDLTSTRRSIFHLWTSRPHIPWRLLFAIRVSDLTICPSDSVRLIIASRNPSLDSKLAVVTNGAPRTGLSTSKPNDSRIRIGFIGSVNPGQPIWRFIEIIAPLLRKSENVQLLVMGAGPLMPNLARRIQDLFLTGKCEIVGTRSEKEALEFAGRLDLGLAFYSSGKIWRGCTLGDSMKARLYLRAGIPVATNLPDLGAVVEARGAGKLLDLNRPGEVLAFVDRITADSKLLSEMKGNARLLGAGMPDWDDVGSTLVQILRQRLGIS
ncbi:hypothetical protein AUG19_08730 [archaeon 13_1_20CM_2_54_9]|nr:MAG: hypothetical protein AUG19_08730 [archaeon 13_1_20CM_2_54_9]